MFVRRVAGAVVVSALVLAACNGDPERVVTSTVDPAIESIEATPTATPTPTPTPSPTPTLVATPTTTAVPTVSAEWAVPDPITDDYVQRVLNELYTEEVPIRQDLLDRAMAGDPIDDVSAITELFRRTRTATDAGIEAVVLVDVGPEVMIERSQQPVGPVVVTEAAVIENTSSCIVGAVVVDYSRAYNEVTTSEFNLKLESGPGNETGWLIAAQEPGTVPTCDS